MQCHAIVSDRLQWFAKLQEIKNAKSAPTPLLPGLLGQATLVLLHPNFVADLASASTVMPLILRAQFQHSQKCEIIVQGGIHQNRELVDM